MSWGSLNYQGGAGATQQITLTGDASVTIAPDPPDPAVSVPAQNVAVSVPAPAQVTVSHDRSVPDIITPALLATIAKVDC